MTAEINQRLSKLEIAFCTLMGAGMLLIFYARIFETFRPESPWPPYRNFRYTPAGEAIGYTGIAMIIIACLVHLVLLHKEEL